MMTEMCGIIKRYIQLHKYYPEYLVALPPYFDFKYINYDEQADIAPQTIVAVFEPIDRFEDLYRYEFKGVK